MTKDYEIARALQERLVQCCIDFIRETGNDIKNCIKV